MLIIRDYRHGKEERLRVKQQPPVYIIFKCLQQYEFCVIKVSYDDIRGRVYDAMFTMP